MAGAQETGKTGFAGLESLASRVDLTPSALGATPPRSPTHTAADSQAAGTTKTHGTPTPAHSAAASSSGRQKAAWAMSAVVVLFLVNFANHQEGTTGPGGTAPPYSRAPESSGTDASNYLPSQGVAPHTNVPPAGSSTDQQVFHVPHYIQAELASDRAAADAAQTEAERLAAEVRSARSNLDAQQQEAERARNDVKRFGDDIELERSYVSSSTDKSEIDTFNIKVDRYNMLLQQARRKTHEANELVDPFNELLTRANQQAQAANRMVDTYNQKLLKYGR